MFKKSKKTTLKNIFLKSFDDEPNLFWLNFWLFILNDQNAFKNICWIISRLFKIDNSYKSNEN